MVDSALMVEVGALTDRQKHGKLLKEISADKSQVIL